MIKYFDVHVFYSRNNGYSVSLKADLTKDYNDDDVISEAVNQGKLDPDDMNYVDYVQEIDEKEYSDMKGGKNE